MRTAIVPIDGPSAYQVRQVREGGSTMATVRVGDDYFLYERRDRQMYSVRYRPTGGFVATTKTVMKAVTEVSRTPYSGVL